MFVLLQVVEVLGRHLEHISCTFAIARSNEWCVEIEVAVLVEVRVNRHRHIVTNAQDCTEGVCARTQVSYCAEVFPTCTFLLQRIGIIAVTEDLDACSLNLACLTCGWTLYEFADNTKACTSRDALQCLLIEVAVIAHNLHVLDCAAIVEGNKEDAFTASLRANPTFHANVLPIFRAL